MSDRPIRDSELFIYLDQEGKDLLMKSIESAETQGHEHLMSEAWGGSELTVSAKSTNSFNKVTITFLK
jgi:hypothetical protein